MDYRDIPSQAATAATATATATATACRYCPDHIHTSKELCGDNGTHHTHRGHISEVAGYGKHQFCLARHVGGWHVQYGVKFRAKVRGWAANGPTECRCPCGTATIHKKMCASIFRRAKCVCVCVLCVCVCVCVFSRVRALELQVHSP